MRLLFLGHSGTLGAGLEHQDDAHTYLVLRTLQETWPDQTHEVALRSLMPTVTSVDRTEKLCREVEPDVVILETISQQFLATVDARVQHLFPRLYPIYARLRDRLALTLNAPGQSRWRRQLYGAMRALLKATLGAEPPVTPEATAEIYCAVLRRLAATESLAIIVVSSIFKHSRIQQQHPTHRATIIRFNQLVHDCAQHMSIPFIDRTGVFDGPTGDLLYQEDGMHRNLAGHRVEADLLLPHLLALGASPVARPYFFGAGSKT